jgi:hypothetical protein
MMAVKTMKNIKDTEGQLIKLIDIINVPSKYVKNHMDHKDL